MEKERRTGKDKLPMYHYPLPKYKADGNIERGGHLVQVKNHKTSNLYIGIPFCKSFCAYCGFVKLLASENGIEHYVETLLKEITMYGKSNFAKENKVSAIYFGGGTASLLTLDLLKQILEALRSSFHIEEDAEITLEGSPSSFTHEKLRAVTKLGINRISMGVQTFNEKYGKMLELPQDPETSMDRINYASVQGFRAVSFDLIYNIPGQTLNEWKEDIEKAIQSGANQLTLFAMTIHDRTKLGMRLKKNELPPLKSDSEAYEFYLFACTRLKEKGYIQFSAVDFVKPGTTYQFCANHFYKLSNIIGMGLGAFGEVNNISYINTGNMDEYVERISNGCFPVKKYVENEGEELYQYAVLKLRELKLANQEFKDKFVISLQDKFGESIEELLSQNYITVENDDIQVTTLGAYHLTDVCMKFISKAYEGYNPAAAPIEKLSRDTAEQ